MNCVRRLRERARTLCAEPLEERCLLSYSITDLGTLPDYTSSAAGGLNASGQVAGTTRRFCGARCDISRAFLYTDGAMNDLGTLDFPNSIGARLNASGQVVGSLTALRPLTSHAFLYDGTSMKDLGTLGGTNSHATGINASGQVVGYSDNAAGSVHAFLYSDGVMTDLNDLIPPESGWRLSIADDLNDSGQVVGFGHGPSGLNHAFLYSEGTVTELGDLGGGYSDAFAINAFGQVVGESLDSTSHYRAFLYDQGAMQYIGTLGGNQDSAYGLNDWGQVVGYGQTSAGEDHAFIYSGSVMTDLNDLLPERSGWTLREARGINNSNQIVGYGIIDGRSHAFLMTPDDGSGPQRLRNRPASADPGIVQTPRPPSAFGPSGVDSGGLALVSRGQNAPKPPEHDRDSLVEETRPTSCATDRYCLDGFFGLLGGRHQDHEDSLDRLPHLRSGRIAEPSVLALFDGVSGVDD